jgi:hypothetical protein
MSAQWLFTTSHILAYAKEHNLEYNLADMCANPAINAFVLKVSL